MSRTATGRRMAKGAALIAAGAIGATALTGLALADDDGTDDSGSQEQATPSAEGFGPQGRGHGGMGKHGFGGPGMQGPVLHGENTVRNAEGDIIDVRVQSGTVASASDSSITVTSEDGFEATYVINGETAVHRDKEEASGANLQTGDTVKVFAEVTDGDVVAIRVGALSPDMAAEAEQQREQMQGLREQMRERRESGKGPFQSGDAQSGASA